MKIEAMHDKNNEFRLYGYRMVAETRDEQRILDMNEWTVSREYFSQETAVQIILNTTRKSAKSTTAKSAEK